MTKRTYIAAGLCLLVAGGCSSQKKADSKVPLDRTVTDVGSTPKSAPASSIPPDPSYVSMPASATQPKFVPVDAPPIAAVPAPSYASYPIAPAPARAPAPTYSPYAGPSVSATPDLPAAPGGATRQYRVQKGDTLFAIARTHYGNGNRWQQIASANPGLTPTSLQAGATIVVP